MIVDDDPVSGADDGEDRADARGEDARRSVPTLVDLGGLQALAEWLVQAAAAGLVGKAGVDAVRAVRRRFGGDRVGELKTKVLEELSRVQRTKKHLSKRELRERIDRIFDEAKL